jgi:phosphoglycolate phosphatase
MGAIRFKTVVFDLDGTLADTAPDLAVSLNAMLTRLGRSTVTVNDVRQMLGEGVHMLVRRGLMATGGVSDALLADSFPPFVEHYEAHIADHCRPWPGADRMLTRLAVDGVSLALCTNRLEGLAQQFLHAIGWEKRFAAIVCGDTLPVRKPDPAPLLEAIRRAGGGPAAFVGDTAVDIATAKAADIPCVIVSIADGYGAEHVSGERRVIHHFDDLAGALAEL